MAAGAACSIVCGAMARSNLSSAGTGCVVVGYDGSVHAREALAHAVERLRPECELLVVHGYGEVPGEIGALRSRQVLEEQELLGRAALERMRSECADLLAGIEYRTELVPEPAAKALADAARAHQADEIVVGTRGFGDARTWLGSVSHELLRIADRPVVVVPPRERALSAERRPLRAEAHRHGRSPRHGSPS
jgi:nucleotide-binding universal stress UspA family protein